MSKHQGTIGYLYVGKCRECEHESAPDRCRIGGKIGVSDGWDASKWAYSWFTKY